MRPQPARADEEQHRTSRTYQALAASSAASETRNGRFNYWGMAAGMLARTGGAAIRVIDALLVQHGMTYSKYSALSLFYHSETSLTLRQVSELLAVNPASVTGLIDRLEGDGLVKRKNHPTDRRTTLASITPKGKEMYEVCQETLIQKEYGFEGIPVEDLEALSNALDRVFQVLTKYER